MKKLLLLALLFVATNIAFAQNAIADLKFEEAEIAFSKQDYETTIKKLDEFDKIFGSISSTSLYLRLIATDNKIDYIKGANTKELVNFEKKVNAYLKSFNDNQVDDKYREIYKISKKIENSINLKKWSEMPEFKEGEKAYDLKNYIKAMQWFEKAAKKDNGFAMSAIGKIFVEGNKEYKQDFNKGFQWFTKASENGEIQASYALGSMYLAGAGVELSEEKAWAYFLKAAEMGMGEAMTMLGRMNENGSGIIQNYSDAIYWYKRASKKKDSDAMNFLGELYYYGNGVQKDYIEAFKWYKLSAETETSAIQLNPNAMNSLGNMYLNGQGVTQDYKEAFKWFSKAADKGWNYAYVNIGNMYLKGKGFDINELEAIRWFNKVQKSIYDNYEDPTEDRKKGLGESYYNLAFKKFKSAEYNEALENYIQAYKYDYFAAKYKIAEIYKSGLGIEKNKKLAREWENK
ncbi:MAG: sel1 repeat family protein [Flavobacteriaceae bacterium]|nr:sel1 repeat family protein [Flavobacteriaceae bacterium]